MSETEHYTGKLTPTGKTIEQYMEQVNVPDYYSSPLDYFNDEMYEAAIAIDGLVFTVKRETKDPYEDIMRARKNKDGSYDFEVKYYNGGCGFSEALEDAVSNSR